MSGGLPWLRLDVGAVDHPKVANLSDRDFRRWLRALSWSARMGTGGELPYAAASCVMEGDAGGHLARDWRSFGGRMAVAGLFEWRSDGGATWAIHDWEDYQPSAGKLKARRKRDAERAQRYRSRKAGVTRDEGRDAPNRHAVMQGDGTERTVTGETRTRNGTGTEADSDGSSAGPPAFEGPGPAGVNGRGPDGALSMKGAGPDDWLRVCPDSAVIAAVLRRRGLG